VSAFCPKFTIRLFGFSDSDTSAGVSASVAGMAAGSVEAGPSVATGAVAAASGAGADHTMGFLVCI